MSPADRPRMTNILDPPARVAKDYNHVHVFAMRRTKPAYVNDGYVVNTTSSSKTIAKELSPFFLGPVDLYDGMVSETMENAWQYAKVYPEHVDAHGDPTSAYWEWAEAGWAEKKASRFPMGRGRAPLYSLWDGERYGYIEARKNIYAPLYAEAVVKTDAYMCLKELFKTSRREKRILSLYDHDGWDHLGQGYSLSEVIEFPKPKMGHAFVLAGLLEEDYFWEE